MAIQRVKPLTIRDVERRWMMAYGTGDTALAAQEIITTSDQKRLWRGDGTLLSGGVDHDTVATVADLSTLYLLPSCTRGVWPGDTAWVTAAGCEYRCVSGANATAVWRAVGAGTGAAGTATFSGISGAPGDNAALVAAFAAANHGHAIAGVAGLQSALDGKQASISNSATLAKIGEADGAPTWNGSAWPGGEGSDIGDLLGFDWRVRVERSGGAMTTDSLTYAADLIAALRTAGLLPKIMRLDAWLGADLAAATTPLIDRLARGTALFGMLESHFSESSGMTFDATNYLSSRYYPSELGLGTNGGLGWWEGVATVSGNVEPIGSTDSGGANRFLLDLRSGTPGGFRWGSPGNVTQPGPGRAAAHYYGQRSSATSRVLYRDGASIATNTTSDAASGASAAPIALGARNYAGTYYPWTGRSKAAYLTRGTFTDAEVAAMHTALAAFVAATGR